MPDAWGARSRWPFWRDALVGPVRLTFLVLLATAALVWIVACANVANLMLARGAARAHEIAAARRARRQPRAAPAPACCREPLLASLGGIAGSLIGWAGVPILAASLPAETPRLAEVAINARLLAFGAVITLVTALAFGLAPAWRAARATPGDPAASERTATAGRARRRWAGWLVAAQVATAVVLVVGANLLLRSLWRLSSVRRRLRCRSRRHRADHTERLRLSQRVALCGVLPGRARTRAHAGASDEEAAVISTLPLTGEIPGVAIAIEDHPRDPADPAFVLWQSAMSPDYFRVMGIPLLRGRGFTDADRDGSPPVAIINAAMARRLWPNADPIGRRLKPMSGRKWRTIVGVVGDVTDYALAGQLDWIDGAAYVPYSQSAGRGRAPWPMTLVARAARDAALARDLPAIVAGVSAEAPVTRVQPMRAGDRRVDCRPAHGRVAAHALCGAGAHARRRRHRWRHRLHRRGTYARDRHPSGARRPRDRHPAGDRRRDVDAGGDWTRRRSHAGARLARGMTTLLFATAPRIRSRWRRRFCSCPS